MYNLITHTFLSLLTINWMENYIRTDPGGVERSEEVKLHCWMRMSITTAQKAHMLHDDDELKATKLTRKMESCTQVDMGDFEMES